MYIYTLDSHDCYGPFLDSDKARDWAKKRNFTSFQILVSKPYICTEVLRPF